MSFYRNVLEIVRGREMDTRPAVKERDWGPESWWKSVGQGGDPNWQMTNLDAFIREGYEQNELIYAAVNYKATAQGAVPLRAYRGSKSKPIPVDDNDKFQLLLDQPNPSQSFQELMTLAASFFNIAGNVFIWIERNGSDIVALHLLHPGQVSIIRRKNTPITSPDFILGYGFKDEEVNEVLPILPADMIHIKRPNLSDPWGGKGYGLSPLFAGARSVDVDNSITTYLRTFFLRGGTPSGFLMFKRTVADDEAAKIRARWRDIYGGYENWSDIGILEEDVTYQRVGANPSEMEFTGTDRRNEARILMVLGVPPILVGSVFGLERSTYSNFHEADRACWRNVLKPELHLFETAFYNKLWKGRLWTKFDLSEVAALQQDVKALVDSAWKLFQMAVPASNAFETVGLQIEQVPLGDVPFLPGGMVLAEDVVNPPDPEPVPQLEPPQDEDETEDDEEIPPEDKAAWAELETLERDIRVLKAKQKYKKVIDEIDALPDKHNPDFEDAAREAFEVDKKEVLAIAKAGQKKAYQQKASIDWLAIQKDILDYLKDRGEENWRSTFTPLIEGLVGDVGDIWALELGVKFDVRNLRGEEWFDNYVLKFAQPINDTTSGGIKEIIAASMADGWSYDETEEWLGLLFDQYADDVLSDSDIAWFDARKPAFRRRMIARTEINRAMGAGAHNLFKEWKVERRMWLATEDDRTRPDHMNADGQVQPMDKPFSVGGYKMDYPGDTSQGAPLDQIIDCRCTVVVYDEED